MPLQVLAVGNLNSSESKGTRDIEDSRRRLKKGLKTKTVRSRPGPGQDEAPFQARVICGVLDLDN